MILQKTRDSHWGSLIRLVGAVLAEQHDERIEGHRYLGLDMSGRQPRPRAYGRAVPNGRPAVPGERVVRKGG